MAVSTEPRQLHPIILTDRVVVPESSERYEWTLTDKLFTRYLPRGFRGCQRPVYIAANRIDHLWALESVGVALSNMAVVDEADFDFVGTRFQGLKAYKAQSMVGEAKNVLIAACESGEINELLFQKLILELNGAGAPKTGFSKRWEVTTLLYASMTAVDLRKDEDAIVKAIFGTSVRSPDLVRKDQDRARKHMNTVVSGARIDMTDAPPPSVIKELSEKYLTELFPLLLSDQHQAPKIQLGNFSLVTRRGGHVTRRPKKLGDENTNRPIDSIPLASLPSGFFASSRL